MDCLRVGRFLIGYVFSAFVGHLIVSWAVGSLWQASGEKEYDSLRPPAPIRFWHGVMERIIYTSVVVLGKPEGIAVWLAFKAIMRWRIRENHPAHISGSNIYMIGTALNVAIGVIGAFIAKWKFSF